MQDLIAKIVSEVMLPQVEVTPSCSNDPATCAVCGRCAVHRPGAVDQIAAAGADRITLSPGQISSLRAQMARLIDHTLLKPEATESEVRRLCEEARKYEFASVCINPCWVPLCAKLLKGSKPKVCTVIGFPLGATTSAAKASEAAQAVRSGAQELDMVINVGFLKSGLHAQVEDDIREVVKAGRGAPVKVIIETCLLSDEEKVKACLAAKQAGASFVKTSTGFSKSGATVGDIALMRRVVGPKLGVKAAGGVRDFATALQMVEAGATRIGASASVGIVG